jgi:hypothetical protein
VTFSATEHVVADVDFAVGRNEKLTP